MDIIDLIDEEARLEAAGIDEEDEEAWQALRALRLFAGARRAATGPTPRAKKADADRGRVKEKLDALADPRFKAMFRMDRPRYDELVTLLAVDLKRPTRRSMAYEPWLVGAGDAVPVDTEMGCQARHDEPPERRLRPSDRRRCWAAWRDDERGELSCPGGELSAHLGRDRRPRPHGRRQSCAGGELGAAAGDRRRRPCEGGELDAAPHHFVTSGLRVVRAVPWAGLPVHRWKWSHERERERERPGRPVERERERGRGERERERVTGER
jgi:hypothetical protein